MPIKVLAMARESLAFLVVVACTATSSAAEEGIHWAPSLDIAKQASAQYRVPVMIHFYGDNCLPCRTLDQRVMNQKQAIETLNKYFICVQINATASQENMEVAASYNVHSWPTDVFLSPDGATLFQGVCPQELKNYIGVLQNVAIMNRDRNLMVAANNASQQKTQSNLQQNYAGTQTPPAFSPNSNPQASGANLPAMAGSPAASASQPVGAGLVGAAGAQGVAANSYVPGQVGPAVQTAMAAPQNAASTPNPNSQGPRRSLLPPPDQMGAYTSDEQPMAGRAKNNYAAAPAASVQSGPLTMNQQPTPITTGMQQPIVHSTMAMRTSEIQQGLQQQTNALPPRNTVGQVVTPASNQAGTPMIPPDVVSSMPTMTSNRASMPAVTPTIRPASTPVRNTNGTVTVENPFYRETDAYGSPKQGAVAQDTTWEKTPPAAEVAPAPVATSRPQADAMQAAPADVLPMTRETLASTPSTPAVAPRTIEFDLPPTPSETQPLTLELSPGGQIAEEVTEQVPSEPEVTFHARSTTASVDQGPASTPKLEAKLASTDNVVPNPEVVLPSAPMGPGLIEEVTPALEGYCPIALVTNNPPQWKDGKEEFAVRHRGRVYWMSSAEAKKAFLAGADKATPLASGYDPLILLEEGRLVEGDIRFGLFEEVSGTYMLFASAEAKQRFWDDFDRYSRALDTLIKRARHQEQAKAAQ